jgi:hypothetical protein
MAKKVAARTLDFSNVKESSGINPKHVEDGDYLAKVVEVRDDPAKDGEAMWLFIFKLADNTTATYPYYCKLVDNQLWKLRNLFIAAGVDLPKRAVKIDPNKVVGKDVGLVLEGEEYEGKMKSVISAIIPKSDLAEYAAGADEDDEDEDEDDEEEVAPAPKKRGRPKKVVEEEEDDDEEEEEPAPKKRGRPRKVVVEEEEDDDDEEEEEPAPVKRGRGRPRKVVEPEEDDDDDEEDEPAPVKRGRGRPRKAAAAPAPARKKRRVVEDDDDDLELDL